MNVLAIDMKNVMKCIRKWNFGLDILKKMSNIIYCLLRRVAQLGGALRSGRRGRRFKSCHAD